MISNRNFVLKTSDGQQSRLRRLKHGVPKGSVLAALLFNIYIHDLPDTISEKYGYADDLAILTVHREWKKIESTLSQDMSTLALYLRQWRRKLSEGKTVSTVFPLNNKEAKHRYKAFKPVFPPGFLSLGQFYQIWQDWTVLVSKSFMQPSMANLNSPSSMVVKDSTPFRRRILRCKNFGKGESWPSLFLDVVNLYLIKFRHQWILNERTFYSFIVLFIWKWILT